MDPKELEHLEALLAEYVLDDRRHQELIQQIDPLLTRAVDEAVPPGATPEQVRRLLGEPHLIFGTEGEERLEWLYPCLPPASAEPRGAPWYLVFEFRDGILAETERRAWIGLR